MHNNVWLGPSIGKSSPTFQNLIYDNKYAHHKLSVQIDVVLLKNALNVNQQI